MAGLLGNLLGAAVNTVKTVISIPTSIAGSLIKDVAAPAVQVLNPVITTALNSSAANIAAGGLMATLNPAAAATIMKATTDSNAAASAASKGSSTGKKDGFFSSSGDGITSGKSGIMKFFTYRKLDENGFYVLDSAGEKSWDFKKIAIHLGVLTLLVVIIYKYGKKKRWWK